MSESANHFRIDFVEAHPPTGISTAAIRSCCGCGEILSSMGGGGTYICQACIKVLTIGMLGREFRKAKKELMKMMKGEET